MDKLCWLLLKATGIKVMLHLHSITDSLPSPVACITPRTKAIHIEVDYKTPTLLCKCITSLYSSKVQIFLLGIKMQLVPKFKLVTNEEAHAKACRFQALQAHFLTQTETSLLCISPNLAHNRQTMYDTLCAYSLTSHHREKMGQPLFYAINPMK